MNIFTGPQYGIGGITEKHRIFLHERLLYRVISFVCEYVDPNSHIGNADDAGPPIVV